MEKEKELYLKNKGKKVRVDRHCGVIVGYNEKWMIGKFESEIGWSILFSGRNFIDENYSSNGCYYLYVDESELVNGESELV